jgi:hypothetical protein
MATHPSRSARFPTHASGGPGLGGFLSITNINKSTIAVKP